MKTSREAGEGIEARALRRDEQWSQYRYRFESNDREPAIRAAALGSCRFPH